MPLSRKLFSMLGALAICIAYLPGAIDASSISHMPDCCNGVMCPMHHMVGGQIICTMDMVQHAGALESCPDISQRYATALFFLQTSPATILFEKLVCLAPVAQPSEALKVDSEVPYPPPRIFPGS
jgi:hypothetical protein